jgi:DNA-directed RNA polymerase III subunit RPC1
VFGPTKCYIQIRLDWDTIRKLGLELTIEEIRKAIVTSKKLKLKSRDVLYQGDDIIKIFVPEDIMDSGDICAPLQRYMRELPHVIVKVYSRLSTI